MPPKEACPHQERNTKTPEMPTEGITNSKVNKKKRHQKGFVKNTCEVVLEIVLCRVRASEKDLDIATSIVATNSSTQPSNAASKLPVAVGGRGSNGCSDVNQNNATPLSLVDLPSALQPIVQKYNLHPTVAAVPRRAAKTYEEFKEMGEIWYVYCLGTTTKTNQTSV